jgi:hypothetical protein
MPPEMLERGQSSSTHDLYGLAATYLALKTNLCPAAFLAERASTPAGLLPGEAAVLAAALHPDPAQRYQYSALAWVRWLAAAGRDEPTPARSNAVVQRSKFDSAPIFAFALALLALIAVGIAGATVDAETWLAAPTQRIAGLVFLSVFGGALLGCVWAARVYLAQRTLRLDRKA